MAVEVEQLVTLLEARITGFEKELKRAADAADRQAKAIERRFGFMNGRLNQQFSGAAKAISASVGQINGLLGTIGAGVSLGAIVNLGRQALEFADNLQDTSEQLGISTDALQVFRFAAGETGVEAGKMDQAILKLNTTIGEAAAGDDAAQKKFRALHIEFRDGAKNVRSTEAVLDDLANLIQSIPDPAQRAAAAATLLGDKLGPRLVPLLRDGAQGLRDYGQAARDAFQVMDRATINELAHAQRQIEKFQVAVTIGAGNFIEFMNDLEDSARHQGAEAKLGRVNEEIARLQKTITELQGNQDPLSAGLDARTLDKSRAALHELLLEQQKLQKFLGTQPQAHAGRGTPVSITPPGSIDLTDDKKAQEVIKDLEAQRAALTQTNREIFVSAELRKADVAATSEQGKKILALADALYTEKFAHDAVNESFKHAAELAAQDDQDRLEAIEAGRDLVKDRTNAILAEIRSQDQAIELARAEIGLVGKTNDEHDETIALLQAKLDLQRMGIDAASAEGQQYLENAEKLAKLNAELGHEQRKRQEIDSFLDDAVNKSGEIAANFAKGGESLESWGDILNDLESEIIDLIVKLAFINPAENALGIGGINDRATFNDVPGILAKLFGGSSSVPANSAGFRATGAGPGASGSGSTDWLSSAVSLFGTLLSSFSYHSGGIAGRGGTRRVPAAAFAGARRFHDGTMPGLRSDEVAAILQKGEPVISLPQLRRARLEMARGQPPGRTGDVTVIQNLPPQPNGFGYSPNQIASRTAESLMLASRF